MRHKSVFILAGILISFTAFANNVQNSDDNNRSVNISIGDGETSDKPSADWIGKFVSSVMEETTMDRNRRFERIDDYILDKFTGDVFFFDPHSLRYPEKVKIFREPSDNPYTAKSESASPGRVNYILTIWKRYPCLINIHTGDLWFMKNPGSRRARLLYVRTVESNE